MLDFFLIYGLIGLFISILINGMLWSVYKPDIGFTGILACILFWPSVIASFINSTGEEIEE